MTEEYKSGFMKFGLPDELLKSLDMVGYETPTPIQEQTIPHLMAGRDFVGQAQTGTGKTAAFALPLLSKIIPDKRDPQVLVLTPTRELAIQVAEAFQTYAKFLKEFYILPVYGGQEYDHQLRSLKRGVHVIVGTPGRVIDHIKRKSLRLDSLTALVLDEADEMLRMGFIDDVQWVIDQIPTTFQLSLFSATMPLPVRNIARKYLKDPVEVSIKNKTATVESTRQRYWIIDGYEKIDALTRILEVEPYDAVLIFVRTKTATVELAEKLSARGFACSALNGDIAQKRREAIIDRLKTGKINLLVATDVAARGLDVDRISVVVNYDIPYDTEAYIHRIGRTGRAGRKGDAILFVTPRERKMFKAIEVATRQKIEQMTMPTVDEVNNLRIQRFKQRITGTIENENLELYNRIVEEFCSDNQLSLQEAAAALARMAQGRKPLLMPNEEIRQESFSSDEPRERGQRRERDSKRRRENSLPDEGMARYRIEVGRIHSVKPSSIVGAIANEGGIDSSNIGRINIYDEFSTVDLMEDIPKILFRDLKKIRVNGQKMDITRMDDTRRFKQQKERVRSNRPFDRAPKKKKRQN